MELGSDQMIETSNCDVDQRGWYRTEDVLLDAILAQPSTSMMIRYVEWYRGKKDESATLSSSSWIVLHGPLLRYFGGIWSTAEREIM